MAETTKDDISISMDETDDSPKILTSPFFSSRSRSKVDTWIITVFVVIQIVVFVATMIVNDCPRNGDCALSSLGRLSFQPLSENPLFGPSSSTLDKMGALQRNLLIQQHQRWRLFTASWLHAGMIDLVISLSSLISMGIHLEQQFGTWRIGLIYILSAFVGSLVSALFVQNNPAVASSGALFGLLGAMLSSLIRNWKIYSDKYAALMKFCALAIINFALGLLPHVDNFSNLGGFLSGVLLGFVLLFNPQLGQVPQNKRGLFEYNDESSESFKRKLDKPAMRSICLVLFCLVLAGGLLAVLHGVNANKICSWCHRIDCIPFKRLSCIDKEVSCKATTSAGRLTLTCTSNNKKYHMFPFTEISQARMGDLCAQLCS